MRRGLAAVTALLLASCASKRPLPHGATPPKPRLVVLIVIDQWPTWIFQQQKHLYNGGIGRLIKQGALVESAELPYANSFTAPGHSTLGTGAVPRETGIVGNYWFRRAEGRDRPAEYDLESQPVVVGPPLGGVELSPDDGASGKALRVEGIADALRRGTNGTGKSVSVSLKSRSACLLAGRKPDLAIWYEPGAGGMTTSSSYAKEPIPWLVELAKTSPASRFYEQTWEARDPALLARETKLPDDAAGESSNHGLGGVFPHKLAGAMKVAFAIQETPFADELVAEAAALAVDKMALGRDNVPDLLAISFSAHDYAGHSWGQESWEELDLTLRLDSRLGELFDMFDAKVGLGQWAVVLTSDHGATPLIERSKVEGVRRITPKEIETAADQAIAQVTGQPGPWVIKEVSNNLYLEAKVASLPMAVRVKALDAAVTAIAAIPSMGGAMRTDNDSHTALDPTCKSDEINRAACKATVPGEAGDIYVWPARGSVITEAKFGTGHDSPSEDNRRVPILVMAPGLEPQLGVGSNLQVAPTVAALLGVEPPAAATQPPLFDLTKR